MEDYINMYDIVGQHEGVSSVQWKNTDTNGGRNVYTVPRQFQQAPNEYQEPLHYPCHEQYQQDKASNVEAVDISNVVNEQNTFNAVKQCSESSPELKKIKRCLCVLTFLLITSLLISAAAAALAVYGFLGVTNTVSIATQNELMTTDVNLLTLKGRLIDLEKKNNLNQNISFKHRV